MELSIKKINFAYKDSESLVIKDLSLDIEKGSWNFLVGETGSGKSTLLQIIAALLPLEKGEIFWKEKNILAKENLKKFRNSVGIMFQYTEKQFFNATVKEEITFTLRKKQMPHEEIEKNLQEIVTLLRIPPEILNRHPLEISGGQKRFVALASILIEKPDVLLLDEPTCGLDVQGQKLFFDVLQELKNEGRIIIQISHILEDVLNYADRAILLEKGEIVRSGKARFVLEGMKTESFEIFNVLNVLGLNTDNFQNIDALLKHIGGKDFAK